MEVINLVVVGIQVLMLPVGTFIAVVVTKAYRRSKLVEYKIVALVFAIQKEIAQNGFSEAYEKKLKELVNEYEFVNKN
ncbi:MAG: hypothetical protein WBH40_17225 [Ignavibacteriaceae bacterium]